MAHHGPIPAPTTNKCSSRARLSRLHEDLRQDALAHPELQVRSNFAAVEERSRRLGVPVQPWPTFVRLARLAAWEQQAVALEKLLKDVPRRLYDNDPVRLASQYGLPNVEVSRLIIAPPNGIQEALSRMDFIEVEGELKLLEMNSGSFLGGTELWTMAEALPAEPLLEPFFERGDPAIRNTSRVMLEHMLRQLGDSPLTREADRLDIANVLCPGGREQHLCEGTLQDFNLAARDAAEALGINVPCAFHCVDRADVEFRRDGVYANGIRLHAILEMYDGRADKDLFRCMKAGQIHLYSGPATALLADKGNVALLYELRDVEVFNEDERELIARSIPWTHSVRPAEVEWDGRAAYLPELLIAERERLVLKPTLASAGDDVFLGRVTPEEEWREVVRRALEENRHWIVQELLVPTPDLYQVGEEGCEPCDVVWGLYVMGGEPGGGYLRLGPAGGGPLNVGQGADVGFYFAVEEEEEG